MAIFHSYVELPEGNIDVWRSGVPTVQCTTGPLVVLNSGKMGSVGKTHVLEVQVLDRAESGDGEA